MKKIFFDICYVATLITIISFLASFIFADFKLGSYLFFSAEAIVFRGIAFLLLFILWIKCIVVWAKKDKDILRFLLLFFLQAFYIIYYYPKVRKNNWVWEYPNWRKSSSLACAGARLGPNSTKFSKPGKKNKTKGKGEVSHPLYHVAKTHIKSY